MIPEPHASIPVTGHRWFWEVLARYAPLYGHVLVASFLVNLLGLAMPLFVMNVYDRIVPNNAFESLWVLATGVTLAIILDVTLRVARTHFVDVAGRNADVLLLGRFMDAVLDTRLDALAGSGPGGSVGGLMARVREFEHVREFLGATTLLAVVDLPFVFLFLGLIFLLGGPLALIPLLALPCMVLFAVLVQWPFRRAAQRQMHDNARKQSLLAEMASGLETIRAARLAGALVQRWDKVVDDAAASQARSRALGAMAAQGVLLINMLLTVILVVGGTYRIAAGAMSMGALIACVILLGRCTGPLAGLVHILANMHKTLLALDQLREIQALPRENPPLDPAPGLEPHPVQALPVDIRLERVTFRYPGQDDLTLAVRDVNLHIPRGQKVAVMGPTGSGKSSLARLCAGLYQPVEGRVLLGTVDMRRMPMRALRCRLGFLPQEIRLFSGTVRDNIRMAWPADRPFDPRHLEQAAELAGVIDFVQDHPLGLDMPVGERGTGLSGGQAQTVALARALLGDPDTLILDEPTSQLDSVAEQRLQGRLAPFLQGRTLLVLTHRLSMLRLAERVLVMDKGRIVRDGSVQEVAPPS